MNITISIYSKLFDPLHVKDLDYYKSFYTTPVHELALRSVFSVNTESIGTSSQLLTTNVTVLQEIYNYGLEFLVDAMQYPVDENSQSNDKFEGASFRKLSMSLLASSANGDEDDSNDITSMTGKVSSSLAHLDEEGDITLLAKSTSNVSRVGPSSSRRNSEVASTAAATIISPSNRPHFGDIDPGLRAELVTNILRILEVWFNNVTKSSIVLRKSKESLGISSTSADLLTSLFEISSRGSVGGENNLPLTQVSLLNLLSCIQWYLQYQFKLGDDTNYSAILASISTLYSMVKTLLKQYHYQFHKNNQFILTLLKADFAPELDKLLMASSNPKLSFNLNLYSRVKIYSVIGILSLLESVLTSSSSASTSKKLDSSDITNLQHHPLHSVSMSNSTYFNDIKIFDYLDFQSQITYKVNSLLSMDFKFWYEFKPDLLEASLTRGSFISWFTGNLLSASDFLNYDTSVETTSVSNNRAEFKKMDKDEDVLKELEDFYSTRYKKMKQNISNEALEEEKKGKHPDVTLISSTLLPILIFLNAHFKNSSFFFALTTPSLPESVTNTQIELLDILLGLSSYVFFYHHNFSVMKSTSRVLLQLFIKLTSKNVLLAKEAGETDYTEYVALQDRTVQFQINEYKWKLCHQKEPIIPINKYHAGYKGYKSSSLYIIDLIQVFLRFNMTKKLDITSYQMCNSILYQILKDISPDSVEGFSSYQWNDFFKTIFNVLLFIKKQNLGEESAVLVEEILVIVDLMLFKYESVQLVDDTSKSITYDLIYNLLLHQQTIQELVTADGLKLANFTYLSQCLTYLSEKFNNSKATLKGDVAFNILDLDYESPEFFSLLSGFKCEKQNDGIDESSSTVRFPETFKYANVDLEAQIGSKADIFKIIDSTLNSF